MSAASGVGSLPGTDVLGAARAVRELYDGAGVPYLVELPARGPGADLIGRTAAQLIDLPVDLRPSGWRLTDAPGRDAGRAAAYLRQDLDVLAEVYDGYVGPLKVQACGPWTLAASLQLSRGERALVDPGAVRDIVGSLAETAVQQLHHIRWLVPGAQLIQQWDEPALPAVLEGRLPTASGYGRLPRPEIGTVRDALLRLAETVATASDSQVLHCCATNPPLALARDVPLLEPAVDLALLDVTAWDALAQLTEDGRRLWAGLLPTDTPARHPGEFVERLLRQWDRLGLQPGLLDRIVVTPACGLAGTTPADAARIGRLTVEASRALRAAVG